MTFIGKRSGSRYVSFRHPSRLTTQDSGRWQEGRRGAGLGHGQRQLLGAPPEASISRCCDIDSRRDHQLCQFEESML